jgi:nucleotide-binding universal stress UspA family protein
MIQNVKKILAPIDFSDFSMEGMHGAKELAADVGAGAEIHLVHVVVPHFHIIPLPLATSGDQSFEQTRESAMTQQAEEELARIKKDEFGNSPKVTTAVLNGSPVKMLIEYAEQNSINLIVLSTHGRSGVDRVMIGSVAEKLVRLAHCSVLVLRRARS